MQRLACLMLLGVAACTPDYPFDKAGTWHLGEVGANDDNLRAMVVNPRDLVAGTGESSTIGSEAAAPVQRLVTGTRHPLLQSNVLQVQLGGQAAQPAAGGGNAGQQ